MSKIKQEKITFSPEWSNSGIDITFTRKAIYVDGWYDSIAGIEGGVITWEQIDEIRERIFAKNSPVK
jgi:hypothetical protein